MSKSRRLDSFDNNGIHSIATTTDFYGIGLKPNVTRWAEPTALTNSHFPLTLFLLQPLSLGFF